MRPLPGALAGLGRGAGHSGSLDRRGVVQLYDTLLTGSASPLPPGAELDRLPASAARRTSAAPASGWRTTSAGLDDRDPRQGRDEPAARVRQLPREAGGGARGARPGAQDRRVALRPVRHALRRGPRWPRRDRRPVQRSCRRSSAASTTTRARRSSSSSADGARTDIGGGGRYDNLVEVLGGPPTPASASARDRTAAHRDGGGRHRPPGQPAIDVFLALEDGAPRPLVAALACGAAAGGHRGRDGLRGPLPQGPAHAGAAPAAVRTVVVGPDSATLRDRGSRTNRSRTTSRL